MQENPQQYTKRILSYVANRDALKTQQGTVKKIQRLVQNLTRKQMMTRPAPGKWSIGEILAHLAESELVTGYRMRMILSANGAPIQAFDQNVWAKNSDYTHQDPDRSLELFRVVRESNLVLLKSIPRKQWGYYGMHEERGKETIARVVEMEAGHDINHLRQIQGIVKGMKNPPPRRPATRA